METTTKPQESKETVLAPLNGDTSIFADILGHAVSNFDGNAMQKMRLDMIASSSKCQDDDKADGEHFAIKYFYIQKVEILDKKTGELNPGTRTVLISPDFKTIDFCSDGVAKNLALIVKNMGMGPYDPAIEVVIRSRKMPSGHRMTYLEPVM